ncbi:MAG: hypothetical protein AAGJ10_05170 [Bacteroidota bacterium]
MLASRIARGFLLLAIVLTTGCAPSIAPLYKDFATPDSVVADAATLARIGTTLEADGWTLRASDIAGVVATEEKVLSSWGIYDVKISLEVITFGDDYVRVLFHPYREFFTGNRSKIPYLDGRLRRSVVASVEETLEASGLDVIPWPVQRDRRNVTRGR